MQLFQRFILYTLLILLASGSLTGCATSPQTTSTEIPGWLDSIPADDRYFYAVGISGPRRNVKDAWNQAAHRARAELGRTIITQVSSKDLVITTHRNEYSKQVIEAISDTELHFTEIIARWYDPNGEYGPPKYYYVLVRMDRKEAAKLLKRVK